MSEQEAILLNQPTQSTHAPHAVDIPDISQRQLAWNDLVEGVTQWRLWLLLAYQDIKLRYRRSILGPFWITISMAMTVYSMGFLYGHLFHMPIQEYFPYLVAGMLTWSLISTTLNDLVDTYSAAEIMLKQIKLPYSLYIHRIVAKNVIIFLHNLLVILPIPFIFHDAVKINWYTLLFVPGLMIIYLNAICYGIILAMIGARYRDIPQVIKSLINIIFFVTPIMWKLEVLPPSKQIIVLLNPFYSFIELIRAPLTGYAPTSFNFIMISIVTLIGMIGCYAMFSARRSRIIYWL